MSNTYQIQTLGSEKVTISKDLIGYSNYLKSRINENPIKIEISHSIFSKVIEYLQILHKYGQIEIPEPLPDKVEFKEIFKISEYPEFIEGLEFEIIFELINAGALLELNGLHDLACAKIAHFMKGKSPEEVNQFFTIECQLTNDEAKELGLEVEDEDQNN